MTDGDQLLHKGVLRVFLLYYLYISPAAGRKGNRLSRYVEEGGTLCSQRARAKGSTLRESLAARVEVYVAKHETMWNNILCKFNIEKSTGNSVVSVYRTVNIIISVL